MAKKRKLIRKGYVGGGLLARCAEDIVESAAGTAGQHEQFVLGFAAILWAKEHRPTLFAEYERYVRKLTRAYKRHLKKK